MKDRNFIMKGNIIFSKDKSELNVQKHAYLVCVDGLCAGVFETLPEIRICLVKIMRIV